MMEEISGGEKQTAEINLRYDTKKSLGKNQDQVWKDNKVTDVVDESHFDRSFTTTCHQHQYFQKFS